MSSIGIIGGADGPTTILISGEPWLGLLLGAALLAAVICLLCFRKK